MELQNLGNNTFRLIKYLPPDTEKAKQPPNRQSVTFKCIGDIIHVIRGNLFLANIEIANEMNKH